MILAIDVHYKNDKAKAVGLLFHWESGSPEQIIEVIDIAAHEYIPGQFYKRELPCVKAVCRQIDMNAVKTIIIDGHVFVSNNGKFGLGGYVYAAFGRKIPVIGVAKTLFASNKETVIEVLRGESKKPLYVSSIGIENEKAAQKIKNMHGKHRMPTILATVDKRTKDWD